MPWRASCCSAGAAAWPSSSTGCRRRAARCRRRGAGRPAGRAKADAPPAPPPDLEFFNGLGGFAADGREYVIVLGPGQSTPAPWINVDRQCRVRLPGRRPRAAATPGRSQQPREPAHALVERSGQRSRPARCSTCATRRRGELWRPTRAADPRRAGALHRAPRPGLQPLRARRARHRARAPAVRAARRSDQDLAPDAAQRLRPRRAACRSPPMSNGCSALARGASAPFIVTEIDAATGAMFARNPWNIDLRVARRLRRSRAAADGMDRRPARIPRPQRHARRSRRAAPATRSLSRRVGAGLDPCGALQTDDRARAGRHRRDRLLPRRGGEHGQARER